MFTQLNPPLPVIVLEKGSGYALAVIDYGQEQNLIWVTALDDNGEIWCAPNPKVRLQKNWSVGRSVVAKRKSNGALQSGEHVSLAASGTQP